MKPKQFYFLMVAALVLIVAAGGYGYWWATSQVNAKTAVLKQKLSDYQVDDDVITKLNALKKQYEQVQVDMPLIDAALPTDKKQSEIVLQLEQLARQAGLGFNGGSFATTTGLPSSTSQTVSANGALAEQISLNPLVGNFGQLENFLRSVEQMNRYVSVTSVTISQASGGESFNITLNAYLKP